MRRGIRSCWGGGRRAGADRGVPARREDRELHQVRQLDAHGPARPGTTASVVEEAWIKEKRCSLDEMGLVLRSSTPLLGETGNPWSYNSFKKRWNAFVRKAGFAGTRPYALRYTFATINLARSENAKTVSVLLGHADASYTLGLYVGFIPANTRGLANRYVGRLVTGLVDDGESMDLRRISGDKAARCAILSLAKLRASYNGYYPSFPSL